MRPARVELLELGALLGGEDRLDLRHGGLVHGVELLLRGMHGQRGPLTPGKMLVRHVTPAAAAAQPTNLYPSPWRVRMYCGRRGLGSSLRRSQATCTSTVRVVGMAL